MQIGGCSAPSGVASTAPKPAPARQGAQRPASRPLPATRRLEDWEAEAEAEAQAAAPAASKAAACLRRYVAITQVYNRVSFGRAACDCGRCLMCESNRALGA